MSDIAKFSSNVPSRVNIAQAVLDARARKNNQNENNEFSISESAPENPEGLSRAKKTTAPAHKGYLEQEEVSFRARVLGEAESPENIRSLARLKRVFDAGQPLRADVPRGYYLNLRV